MWILLLLRRKKVVVKMKKNVTMTDIAQQLNISTVTVSKALANKDGVSKALRQKILELASQMGYRHTSSAKALQEGHNYSVGILVHKKYIGSNDSFYLQAYQKIIDALSRSNYFAIQELISDQYEQELVVPKLIKEGKIDGLIILGQIKENYLEFIQSFNVPVMLFDFYNKHYDYDAIISDNFYSAYMITNHLIESGHKDIGFVGNIHATSSILDRYLGYCKSLIENKLPLNDHWLLNDRTDDGKYIEIEIPSNMPTAFVVNCDEVAYLFMNKLNKEGYSIPKDTSIVSFDNYIYATLTDPQLTTVEVNLNGMAQMVTEELIKKIKDHTHVVGRKMVSNNIIYRDSVMKI